MKVITYDLTSKDENKTAFLKKFLAHHQEQIVGSFKTQISECSREKLLLGQAVRFGKFAPVYAFATNLIINVLNQT